MNLGPQAIQLPYEGNPYTLLNNGAVTVYYGGQYVSASSNAGSVAPGASVVLTQPYWVISPNGPTEIEITTLPQNTSPYPGYAITTMAVNIAAGNFTMDLSIAQRFLITLSAPAVTLAVGGGTAPQQAANGAEVILIQDVTGGRTVVWPGNTRWAGGVAPTLTSTGGHEDDFFLQSFDAMATWRGFVEGLDMR